MVLSPIVLFVYNRPAETRLTLEALSKNVLADESILYVYADGLKDNANEEERIRLREVRSLVKSTSWCKEVHLIESSQNNGLANSVIRGVTEVVKKFGSIIVLEDDIVTSRYFLKFMNDGLSVYRSVPNVYAINSYMFPIESDNAYAFLSPMATSTWGWATWADKWQIFEVDLEYKEVIQRNSFLRSRFDLAHYSYSNMLNNNNSWGIKWYYSAFVRNGLGVFPSKTLSSNIGFGQEATHTKSGFKQMDIYEGEISVELESVIDFKIHEKILNYFTNRLVNKDLRFSRIKKVLRRLMAFGS